jgi:glucokinase
MGGNSRLVVDVGGTNARFAVTDVAERRPALREPLNFTCADFPKFEDAMEAYLRQHGGLRPREAVVAWAGPVSGGAASCTNSPWVCSEDVLRRAGFERSRLINDYAALALALPALDEQDLGLVGPAVAAPEDQSLAVLGAGTGLGVAALARDDGTQVPVVSEGGHAGFAPVDDTEAAMLRLLQGRFGRVSLERLLSGPGLANIHWALAVLDGRAVDETAPSEIVRAALKGEDDLCVRALDQFCAVYGSVAGDVALTYGARGGVFLGGGIAPRILPILRSGPFRARFEAKGRLSDYVAAIPTKVILHPFASLVGAAVFGRVVPPGSQRGGPSIDSAVVN